MNENEHVGLSLADLGLNPAAEATASVNNEEDTSDTAFMDEDYAQEDDGDELEEEWSEEDDQPTQYDLRQYGVYQSLPIPSGPPDLQSDCTTAEEYIKRVRCSSLLRNDLSSHVSCVLWPESGTTRPCPASAHPCNKSSSLMQPDANSSLSQHAPSWKCVLLFMNASCAAYRYEAQQLPQTVTSTIDPRDFDAQRTDYVPAQGVHAVTAADCIPSHQWLTEFLADFANLRAQLHRYNC